MRRQPEQAELIARVGADVIALQELTARTLPLWRASLAAIGFAAAETSLDAAPAPAGRRALGVLTAARLPLTRLEPPPVPWPERVLCCAFGDIELSNVHSPIAPAPDLAKIRTHEAIAAHLAARDARRQILCGDLNTPRREHSDGDVLTFAYDSAGRLRPERGERWDRAERALVHGLRERGWVDAFRALHGYAEREASWTFANNRGGWRLDHVLVFGVEPIASAYAHDWRRAGLSDHSALVVDLDLSADDSGGRRSSTLLGKHCDQGEPMTDEQREREPTREREPRDKPDAEGGDSDAARKPPAAPAEDSSPLGDTDHHSEADAKGPGSSGCDEGRPSHMSATAPTKGLQDVGPFAGYARDERPLDAYGALTAACGAASQARCSD